MNSPIRKICVLATHHAYQYKAFRRAYFDNLKCLIEIHSVDFIGEEASGIGASYAKRVADALNLSWQNVDLTRDERKYVPDLNPLGIGTQVDPDLQILREWIWVIRTARAMKQSALLICGLGHLTGIATKFLSVGFEVEMHVYFDKTDDETLAKRIE